jgi:histidinol-phosphate phosphatase family protein
MSCTFFNRFNKQNGVFRMLCWNICSPQCGAGAFVALSGKLPIAVVLVGGLGTRLRPLTLKIPKPLIPINGTPFLSFVLEKISSLGIKECLLLTGYKHHMVRKYCGSGKRWGLHLHYSRERRPMGTGGALLAASKKINGTALVLNGDSFLDMDLHPFMSFHRRKKALISIFALHGSLAARGAIKISPSGRAEEFLEKQKFGVGFFNTGAYLVEKSALDVLGKMVEQGALSEKFSMEKDGFPFFVGCKKLYAFRGKGRFLDIGTFESLSKASRTVDSGGVAQTAHRFGGAAVFLDRDGVINRHRHDYVKHPGEFEFEQGALEGMARLSRLGLPLFIVTNQSIISRGIATREMLEMIHAKMLSGLRLKGVEVADVLICPHKPEDGCACRKPKIGMLIDAKERFGLSLSKCFVVGDSTGDIAMGSDAGCITVLVGTGYGGKDGRHQSVHNFFCKDLKEAASVIERELGKRKPAVGGLPKQSG